MALQPATGGTFVVTIEHAGNDKAAVATATLWDRGVDGGFPETKELKRRVRDVIDPSRDLGHVDGHKKEQTETKAEAKTEQAEQAEQGGKTECQDCQ